jgi:hypothetical protein
MAAKRHLQANEFWPSVGRLGRHLPVLGGLLGLPVLCAGAASAAHRVSEAVFGGGDVTVALNQALQMAAVALVKADLWIDRAMAFVFGA